MSDTPGERTALREALAAFGRGELGAEPARARLWAASEAEGRPPRELLDEEAPAAGLDPVARDRLAEPDAVGDATRVAGSAADGPADDDQATRIAAPDRGEADDATRPAGGDAGTTGSQWTWSSPERWRDTRDEPVGAGRVLKDRFVLEELIGHGGMGAVYRARDLRREEAEDRDPYVAVKLLNDSFREHPDALVALQREAKKAQTLAHPNIATVYDFDRDGTTVFLTMALMRGEPLDAVIRGRGAFGLPARETVPIIEAMARGLAYAHEQGFVHADFKPGNVFLDEAGRVRILDFGIARAAKLPLGGGGGDETRFDPATIGAITPAYASPEMLGGEAPEPADDVYALACVAHELVTGRHPFIDEAGHKLPADEAARRGLQPAPLPAVPKRVRRAVQRGLAFRRAERFADAGAFLAAVRRPARIRRTALAAMVALAVLAGVSWWITIRESDVIVSLDDLPPALSESRAMIRQGDAYADDAEMAQAHKLYAQAWENAQDLAGISERDRSRLRVVVERRINDVIDHYVARSRDPELDRFSLELVRLTLESLGRHELGDRDEAIQEALARVNRRLDSGTEGAQ